jgi:hypothetical protein
MNDDDDDDDDECQHEKDRNRKGTWTSNAVTNEGNRGRGMSQTCTSPHRGCSRRGETPWTSPGTASPREAGRPSSLRKRMVFRHYRHISISSHWESGEGGEDMDFEAWMPAA